jgi:hypothetical protein
MADRVKSRARRAPTTSRGTPAECLADSERLFADFAALTPYKYRPFVKTFDSFRAYERWRRAQRNPWYR